MIMNGRNRAEKLKLIVWFVHSHMRNTSQGKGGDCPSQSTANRWPFMEEIPAGNLTLCHIYRCTGDVGTFNQVQHIILALCYGGSLRRGLMMPVARNLVLQVHVSRSFEPC